MVLALIPIAVVGVLIFTFQEQIRNFFDDLRKPKSEEQIERDERGAIENTQAFILGEKGLADLKADSEANKIAINQFIKDSQTNIDLGLQGVNTTLVTAQQNLEKFAKESQATIVNTVDDSSKAFNESLSGAGEGITKFFNESALNIQNFFGGQTMPKAIATTINPSPPITTKSGTPVIDTAFLTSVEPISGQGSKITEPVLEKESIESRFSGSGSLR